MVGSAKSAAPLGFTLQNPGRLVSNQQHALSQSCSYLAQDINPSCLSAQLHRRLQSASWPTLTARNPKILQEKAICLLRVAAVKLQKSNALGALRHSHRGPSVESSFRPQKTRSSKDCRGQKTLLTGSFGGRNLTGKAPALSASRQAKARKVRCQAASRTANLTACRCLNVPLPVHTDRDGRPRTLSEFLKLPVGREAMLKGQSCKRKELIGEDTFRCYLRSIEAFKFSVSPVIDVRVTSTDDTCTVEMLQCRFLGSEAVERQNDRFSASFRNHIDWRENGSAEPELQNEIRLDLALEVFTPPFTMLPLSAVERPGSTFLQALLDRVAPAFVDSLLADYKAWAEGELDEIDVSSERENDSPGRGSGHMQA